MAEEFGEVGGLVMVDGPGWDAPVLKEPAISRYNRMAIDDPRFGHNDILDTISRFDNSRYYAIQDDDDDELDEFVRTLYLDDVGENGYNVDGDPYGQFKKEFDGVAPEPDQPMYPELAAQNAADFIAQFGKIFAGQ